MHQERTRLESLLSSGLPFFIANCSKGKHDLGRSWPLITVGSWQLIFVAALGSESIHGDWHAESGSITICLDFWKAAHQRIETAVVGKRAVQGLLVGCEFGRVQDDNIRPCADV